MTSDPEDHEHQLQQQYEAGKVDGFEAAKAMALMEAEGLCDCDPDVEVHGETCSAATFMRAIAAMKVQP